MESSITGIKSIYTVTTEGILYVTHNAVKTPLNVYVNSKGYLQCHVYRENGTMLTTSVHRLVAIAFIPNPDNLPQVNHIDCNKLNNCVSNLEWVTQEQNMAHAVENNVYTIARNIYKYDTSYNLVSTYENVTEAIKDNANLTYNDLSKCLSSRATNVFAKGFYWFDHEVAQPVVDKHTPIYVKDASNIEHGPYASIKEVMDAYPCFTSKGSLSTCISKCKPYKGYTIYHKVSK